MVHMSNRQVLEDIRGYAAARRVRVASHGRRRMSELGVTYDDLRYGLMNATECEQAEDGRWRVGSTDRSGDRMTVILLFWDGLLVVTVF
jgi:hypothetical protein